MLRIVLGAAARRWGAEPRVCTRDTRRAREREERKGGKGPKSDITRKPGSRALNSSPDHQPSRLSNISLPRASARLHTRVPNPPESRSFGLRSQVPRESFPRRQQAFKRRVKFKCGDFRFPGTNSSKGKLVSSTRETR